MKFKIDENLPVEAAGILKDAGFAADTIADEDLSGSDDETVAGRSRSEDRVLVTLDLDFSNIQAYPPGTHAGIIVLRLKRQDKATVLAYLRRVAVALSHRSPARDCGSLAAIEYDFARGDTRRLPGSNRRTAIAQTYN